MTQLESAVTFGQICLALGQRDHRVRYILSTRRDIIPLRMTGIARLYPHETIEKVRAELSAIDARRKAVPA